MQLKFLSTILVSILSLTARTASFADNSPIIHFANNQNEISSDLSSVNKSFSTITQKIQSARELEEIHIRKESSSIHRLREPFYHSKGISIKGSNGTVRACSYHEMCTMTQADIGYLWPLSGSKQLMINTSLENTLAWFDIRLVIKIYGPEQENSLLVQLLVDGKPPGLPTTFPPYEIVNDPSYGSTDALLTDVVLLSAGEHTLNVEVRAQIQDGANNYIDISDIHVDVRLFYLEPE